jgi:chromosome segregation ATPase
MNEEHLLQSIYKMMDTLLEEKLDAKLYMFEEKLDSKFDTKLSLFEEKLNHKFDSIDIKFASINSELLGIQGTLKNHEYRLERIENKVDNMDVQLASNQEQIMNNFVDIKETQTIVSIHSEKLKVIN